jgi:mitochondrial import inner membrane translocase subunit TIM9
MLQRLHQQSFIIQRGLLVGNVYYVCADGSHEKKEACVMNCTEKFIKHSERVGARFAEQNAGVSHFANDLH